MKNKVTHVTAGALITAGVLLAGSSFHHQQNVQAELAHQRQVKAQVKAENEARQKAVEKARAEAVAAQAAKAAAQQKATVVPTKPVAK